jgi:hypothetical protein
MDSWTYIIEGAADTLPPDPGVYLLAIHEERGISEDARDIVLDVLYSNGVWQVWNGDDWIAIDKNPMVFTDDPYAWIKRPEAPPYLG